MSFRHSTACSGQISLHCLKELMVKCLYIVLQFRYVIAVFFRSKVSELIYIDMYCRSINILFLVYFYSLSTLLQDFVSFFFFNEETCCITRATNLLRGCLNPSSSINFKKITNYLNINNALIYKSLGTTMPFYQNISHRFSNSEQLHLTSRTLAIINEL